MQIGTVVICKVPGSFSNFVGVVVAHDQEGSLVTLNDESVIVKPEHILSTVGITEESIELAKDSGRWMRS